MKSKIKGLLLPLACLSPGAANAQALPSVFGVQLGVPVTLPECPHLKGAAPEPDGRPAYAMEKPVTCAELPFNLSRARIREVSIFFPFEAKPELSLVRMIGAYVPDDSDNVIAIDAATPGYTAAAYIIAQLTAKFGKPTTVDEDREIYHGVSIPTKHVIWKRVGFTVDYQSFADDISSGELLVSTDEYDRLIREGETARDAKRTPL